MLICHKNLINQNKISDWYFFTGLFVSNRLSDMPYWSNVKRNLIFISFWNLACNLLFLKLITKLNELTIPCFVIISIYGMYLVKQTLYNRCDFGQMWKKNLIFYFLFWNCFSMLNVVFQMSYRFHVLCQYQRNLSC